MKGIIPNLFIIGAPKSGTTSLYRYLSMHPKIFMCTPKEPHYFSNDLNGHSFVNTLDEYHYLFKKRKKIHKIIGEASVWHLYSANALKNIYKYNKNAKIIVMLRNPIDLFRSLHQNFLFNGFENIEDLNEAWNSQKSRQMGVNVPKHCPDKKFLLYSDILKFGDQIEKLYSIFPEKQIKIIIFDDFISQTKYVYKSILSFLDLEYDNRVDFPVINQSKESRIKVLNNYFLNPPKSIKRIWGLVKKIFGNRIILLSDKIILANTKKIIKNKDIDLKLSNDIKNQHKDDIYKLSNIINKDLNGWFK